MKSACFSSQAVLKTARKWSLLLFAAVLASGCTAGTKNRIQSGSESDSRVSAETVGIEADMQSSQAETVYYTKEEGGILDEDGLWVPYSQEARNLTVQYSDLKTLMNQEDPDIDEIDRLSRRIAETLLQWRENRGLTDDISVRSDGKIRYISSKGYCEGCGLVCREYAADTIYDYSESSDFMMNDYIDSFWVRFIDMAPEQINDYERVVYIAANSPGMAFMIDPDTGHIAITSFNPRKPAVDGEYPGGAVQSKTVLYLYSEDYQARDMSDHAWTSYLFMRDDSSDLVFSDEVYVRAASYGETQCDGYANFDQQGRLIPAEGSNENEVRLVSGQNYFVSAQWAMTQH